jgi:hypothetical protein
LIETGPPSFSQKSTIINQPSDTDHKHGSRRERRSPDWS